MRRKLIALGMGLAMLAGQAGAEQLPDLYVNGARCAGVAYVEDGTTYVSLRTVAQALDPDADIAWEDGQAVVRSDEIALSAVPGQQWLTANGRYLYIAGGVQVEDGRTLVPVRVLAEAFGARVDWDGDTGRVTLDRVAAPPTAEYDEDALYWMSRIISSESRGESLRGQIAVGNVVLNRVADDAFPDTIYGVIFDERWGGQFEPVRNGTIYQEPTQQSIVAAKLVLEGTDVAEGCLYFLDPGKAENLWTVYNRPYIMTIGTHDFYG